MAVKNVTLNVKQHTTQYGKKKLLEMAGYKVEFMWECEWNKIKNDLPNKHELETKTSKQHIRIRDALCGGRQKHLNLTLNVTNTKTILLGCL